MCKPSTNSFHAVAELHRQAGRSHRGWAWRILWIATFYAAFALCGAVAIGILDDPENWIALILACSAILVVAAAPIASLAFFLHALIQVGHAQRNENAARDIPISGDLLLRTAEKSRRAAERYECWQPRALKAGCVLLGLSVCGFGAGLILTRFDWERVASILTLNGWALELPLLVSIAFFGPAVLLRGRSEKRRRQAEMLELCHDLGFTYLHLPAEAHLVDFAALPLFGHGWQRAGLATHLMAGEIGGVKLHLMLYAYNHEFWSSPGHGWQQRLSQTVVITLLRSTCPAFRLWPTEASELDLLGFRNAKRARPIEPNSGLKADHDELPTPQLGHEGETECDYRLFGRPQDRNHLLHFMSGRVFGFLQEFPRLVIEAGDGRLAVYEPGVVWNAEQFRNRIALALALATTIDGKSAYLPRNVME